VSEKDSEMRVLIFVIFLAACGPQSFPAHGPQQRAWGVWQPACIIMCEAVVETADAVHGNASTGSVSQQASRAAGSHRAARP
jgi:hypothetical protein